MLVERTLVYDIIEQMGDAAAAIAHYTTEIDLSWLQEPFSITVQGLLLVSADRDLIAEEIPRLKDEFGVIAGDWELGVIAHVDTRNQIRCLILRGVTDLVGSESGEAYGNINVFAERAKTIMTMLVDSLTDWMAKAEEG